jgi:hypothetical protein
MMISRLAVSTFAAMALIAAAMSVPVPEAWSEQPPILTLELAIVHGKLSTPREKREVSKARLVVDNDRERKIDFNLPIVYSTTSAGGTQIQFINGSTPSFRATAKPISDGVDIHVDADYFVPVPVPETFTPVASAAVSPKTAFRGFEVWTQIALQAKEGASVELASIEDPVTDGAWSAIVTVIGVKGAPAPGVLPKNTTFTAKVEEGDGKTSTTTTLRVATSDAARESRIFEGFKIPYASTSAGGTNVQFINFPVELTVGARKASGSTLVQLMMARQRGSGNEPWPVFDDAQEMTLVPGVSADLGSISEGGRTVHATFEERTE